MSFCACFTQITKNYKNNTKKSQQQLYLMLFEHNSKEFVSVKSVISAMYCCSILLYLFFFFDILLFEIFSNYAKHSPHCLRTSCVSFIYFLQPQQPRQQHFKLSQPARSPLTFELHSQHSDTFSTFLGYTGSVSACLPACQALSSCGSSIKIAATAHFLAHILMI